MKPKPPTEPSAFQMPSFSERHYTFYELAELWNVSYEKVRRICASEPGVIAFGGDEVQRKLYRVPESVAKRIYNRMVKP